MRYLFVSFIITRVNSKSYEYILAVSKTTRFS